MNKRVLFTTQIGPNIGFFKYAMPNELMSIHMPFPAMGLRFLKANVPGIRMLEYPSWDEYLDALRQGVDILGLSFFTKDYPVVKRMIEVARKHYGVKEIWGGNYGVLTPGASDLFDRIFTGYAEDQVHQALYRRERVGELDHPIMVMKVHAPALPMLQARVGIVLTHRGCNLRCTFCQTPQFAPVLSSLPQVELERIVDTYYRMGIRFLLFAEENFIPSQNRALLDRIGHYGMKWTSQSRADSLKGRIHKLKKETGYAGSIMGIESIRDSNLGTIDKRQSINTIIETLKEAKDAEVFMQGTYMFGYENDTMDSLKDDSNMLLGLPLMVNHYFILTPYPKTQVGEELERKYGIFTRDWSRYDSRHLVWNHPNIKRDELEKFMDKIRGRAWNVGNYTRMGLRALTMFSDSIKFN